ncbi:MAG: ATP-dependent helicase [Desulfobulbus sp.]
MHAHSPSAHSSSVLTPDALNPAQYAAATHGDGPLLVIAGAGSGKTRTLVYRMAHLIEQGVPPESILLLTFTRRAAQEMLHRAGELTAGSCRRVMGGTFHATANLLLRQHGHHLGLGPNFTIIDRADSEGIINLLKSSLGMSGADKRFPSKRVIMNLISGSINKALSMEQIVLDEYPHLVEFVHNFHEISGHYQQFKQNHALLDYDDLLIWWRRLLTESEQARDELSRRFTHILVDEYQDINHLQAEIVRLLAGSHRNVMVVGDDAQSIYSFRGADFSNIMRFPEQYPDAVVVKLEENYRSTEPILNLTNDIIAHAEQRFTKNLFTSRQGGEPPVVAMAPTEAAEARFVVETIRKHREQGLGLENMAVLFRSAFHSYKLEIELASHGIEFDKRGGLKLTESAHIKDLLAFFRVVVNPWDNLSWNRLLLHLDKVGPKTAEKILRVISETDDPCAALAAYPPGPAWKKQFGQLAELLPGLRDSEQSPEDQFDLVMEYYDPLLVKLYADDYPKRRRDLDQIKILISGYGDLHTFLDDVALDPPEVTDAAGRAHERGGRLILSTIHSAKGLEWDTVFVIGLAEGRFPHQNTLPGEQWEEERRLLYVAATRAQKTLYLTWPRELATVDRRMIRAGMSPLLREINPNLYRAYKRPAAIGSFPSADTCPEPVSALPKRTESARTTYTEGMRIHHPFFGLGQITAIPGPRRVEVRFDRHGSKILHLDYTKLEVVG